MECKSGSLFIGVLLLFAIRVTANAQMMGPAPYVSAGDPGVLAYDFTSPFPLNGSNVYQSNGMLSSNGANTGTYNYSIYKCVPEKHSSTLSLDKRHLLELQLGNSIGIYWGVLKEHSLQNSCTGMENVQGSASFGINLVSANSYTSGATFAGFELL